MLEIVALMVILGVSGEDLLILDAGGWTPIAWNNRGEVVWRWWNYRILYCIFINLLGYR